MTRQNYSWHKIVSVMITLSMLGLLLNLAVPPAHGQGSNFQPSINAYVTPWACGQGRAVSGVTAIDLNEIYIPAQLTFSKMTVVVNTGDAGNNYSWGLYTTSGTLIAANTAATIGAGTGSLERTNTTPASGGVTIGPGNYLIAVVGDNATGLFGYGGTTGLQQFTTATVQAGGQVPATIVVTATAATSQGVQRSTLCMAFR